MFIPVVVEFRQKHHVIYKHGFDCFSFFSFCLHLTLSLNIAGLFFSRGLWRCKLANRFALWPWSEAAARLSPDGYTPHGGESNNRRSHHRWSWICQSRRRRVLLCTAAWHIDVWLYRKIHKYISVCLEGLQPLFSSSFIFRINHLVYKTQKIYFHLYFNVIYLFGRDRAG